VTKLRDDALAAFEAAVNAEKAEREAEKNQLVATARARLATVLAGADGKPRNLADAKAVNISDRKDRARLVVFAVDDIALAVRERDGAWEAQLVVEDDGWTTLGRFESLAELGRLLRERTR
jgi:hypothetical protein